MKAGENLASIATKNHTTPKALRLLNHLKSDAIQLGMNLQLPNEAKPNLNKSVLAQLENPSKPKMASASTSQSYAVKKGDNILSVSRHFSVTPKELAAWNNVSVNTTLTPGKKLTIKAASQQVASAAPMRLISYTVGKNDSLNQISKKFNVPVNDLRKSNPTVLAKGLYPGLKLKIIVDGNQFAS